MKSHNPSLPSSVILIAGTTLFAACAQLDAGNDGDQSDLTYAAPAEADSPIRVIDLLERERMEAAADTRSLRSLDTSSSYQTPSLTESRSDHWCYDIELNSSGGVRLYQGYLRVLAALLPIPGQHEGRPVPGLAVLL